MSVSPEPDEIGLHAPFYRGVAVVAIALASIALAIGFIDWQGFRPRWTGEVGMLLLIIGLVLEVLVLIIKPSLRFEDRPPRFMLWGVRVPVLTGLRNTVLAWCDHRPTLLMLAMAFPIKIGLFMVYIAIGGLRY